MQIALNTPHLDFSGCNFSERNMKVCTMQCLLSLPHSAAHFLSLPLTSSHCLSLPLTTSHCLSLPLTTSHYLSLPLTDSHCRSLTLTTSEHLHTAQAKDKGDGLSKEGSGRVGMYKHTDLPHCYTLECNYNTGRIVNATPDAATSDGRCSPGRAPDRWLLLLMHS